MLVQIDHKLRIARSELPPDVQDLIVDALSIPNIERQHQMEQGVPGWQSLPEKINLWTRTSGRLILPRGFYRQLVEGLTTLQIDFEVDDRTTFDDYLPEIGEPVDLRPWQSRAVVDMLEAKNGIWKAPAGSGKTVGVLEAVRRLNCPSLVIVNTKDILYQWVERAKQFLGVDYPVATIGDGEFSISDYLTIATVQTLHSRYVGLVRSGFFSQFSLVCLDECHHATADTFNRILGRFDAKYRFGVSATPDKTGDFALAQAVLGPIIHETKREDVDTLVKPVIFRIPTGFRFKYRGRMGHIPSNYPELVQNLIRDDQRNALIICAIMLNAKRHILVCSRRLEQLHTIREALEKYGYPNITMMLTGEETTEARKAVIDYASLHPCVILSTLADEALDIPRLDGLFLVFPQRNTGLIEQQVGRIARQHPEKRDAAVFDFCDNIGPLEAQWQARRREVYQKHGYKIETVTPKEIAAAMEDFWK
jgi:superfamily II DNA or RNA helicase